jgi:RNA polymerase sigma-70 factor (ECF subfamily)
LEEATIFEPETLYKPAHTPMSFNIGMAAQIEVAFKTHFRQLFAYAITMVKDDVVAEEMVQNVFYKLWKNKDQLEIGTSLNAYLYRSVYNECLNHMKHEQVKAAYQQYTATQMNHSNNAGEHIRLKELQQRIDTALKDLPEQCRTIFQMSRFEELKYAEIASKLGLSIKTVENQMGKALKLMRVQLADYLPTILILLLNL